MTSHLVIFRAFLFFVRPPDPKPLSSHVCVVGSRSSHGKKTFQSQVCKMGPKAIVWLTFSAPLMCIGMEADILYSFTAPHMRSELQAVIS